MSQRAAFTVSLVSMINSNNSQLNLSEECPFPSQYLNNSHIKNGEFAWSDEVESQLLGAMFYGYIVTQLPGGLLAEKFGARLIFGLCSLLSGIVTMLCPLLARWDQRALLVARVFVGLFQGPLFPSNHALWGRWAPVMERSNLFTVSCAGEMIGYFVANMVSGYLCDSSFLGGWPAPLYLSGGFSCLWFFVWMLIAHNSPAEHKWISDEERHYIEQSLIDDNMPKYTSPPWKEIIRSRAVLCLVVYFTCDGLGFYVFFSCVPLYMKQVLHYDMSQDGVIMSLPYLGGLFMRLLAGVSADAMRRRGCLSTTAVRKLFTTLGLGSVSVFLVCIGLVDCNHVVVVVLVAVGFSLYCLTIAGAAVTFLDFAPIYAGTLMGFTNPFGNIGGFVSPVMQDAITHGQASKERWRIVFFVAAAIYLFGLVTFLIFGTSEPQPWAHEQSKKKYKESGEIDSIEDHLSQTSEDIKDTSGLINT